VKNSEEAGVQKTWEVVGSQMVVELVHVHMDLDHSQVPEEYLVGLVEEELNHHNFFKKKNQLANRKRFYAQNIII